MPLSRETIPNFSLNGQELALYTRELLSRTCKQRGWSGRHIEMVIGSLERSLSNDWAFRQSYTYPDAEIKISLRSHAMEFGNTELFAFDLEAYFVFPANSSFPNCKPFVRRPAGASSPPINRIDELAGFPKTEIADCFTLEVKCDNPNLIRVHCGLPIVIAEKVPPKHGDLFGTVQNHEIRYDPHDYEPLPEPQVTDNTEEYIELWRLPTETLRPEPRNPHQAQPPDVPLLTIVSPPPNATDASAINPQTGTQNSPQDLETTKESKSTILTPGEHTKEHTKPKKRSRW